MDVAKAIALVDAFQEVPRGKAPAPTFMEIAGYPHYENVCSNILAFFLDPESPHGLGLLCLNALFDSAKAKAPPLSGVIVDREVETTNKKLIDILITSDTHIVAIENKLFAGIYNPFEEYAQEVDRRAKEQIPLKILLALAKPNQEPGHGFEVVLYAQLIGAIRAQLGHFMHQADTRYRIYLADFLNSIEKLHRGNEMMDGRLLSFFSERETELIAMKAEFKKLEQILRARVQALASTIEIAEYENVKQSFYREIMELYDILVFNVTLPNSLVAVDAAVRASGWEIEIFIRSAPNGGGSSERIEELRELLRKLEIPFGESARHPGTRVVYLHRFNFEENDETLREHLQELIRKLANAKLSV